MAIRKSIEEKVVLDHPRSILLEPVQKALGNAGFKKITINKTMWQISGVYHSFTTWGEILIILVPVSNNRKTEMHIKSTASIDNIYALFSSPNKKIINLFKSNFEI